MPPETVFVASGAAFSSIDVGLNTDRYACKSNGVTVDISGIIYVVIEPSSIGGSQYNRVQKFPVLFNGTVTEELDWDNESTVETVVLLHRVK